MKTEKKLTGLERQENFLRQILSTPIWCPSCRGNHSYIEAAGDKYEFGSESETMCPVTGEKLRHNVALVGGAQSWSIIEPNED